VETEEEIVERLGEGRILVMDDDQTVCNLLGIMLEQLGYVAETANNGEEVLEKYTEAQRAGNPFNAVIMDLIVTTGMGGRDTMEELKKIDPYARAIISSGYVHNSILSDYRCYGFQAVLPKPYRLSDLKNALKCVLRDQLIVVQQDIPAVDGSPPL